MPKKKLKTSPKKAKKKVRVKKSNHGLRNKILGLLFLVLALAILVLPSYIPLQSQNTISNTKDPIKISSQLLGMEENGNNPVRILIPHAGIDLPVVNAKVVNGYWELSDNTASYGLGSGHPGMPGNTVIFAHARQGLFYNLKDVNVGDIVYVFTKNKWYRYKVNKITAVYPNQTEVIQPTKTDTLTLYTCTGFYDEKRLIVTAIPQS